MSDVEQRAAQAEAILNNPAWRDAYDAVDTDLWAAFKGTAPHNVDALVALAHRSWALETVRAELEAVMLRPQIDKLNAE